MNITGFLWLLVPVFGPAAAAWFATSLARSWRGLAIGFAAGATIVGSLLAWGLSEPHDVGRALKLFVAGSASIGLAFGTTFGAIAILGVRRGWRLFTGRRRVLLSVGIVAAGLAAAILRWWAGQ